MPEPDQSWGLDLDTPMASFIPKLAKELEDRCQAVRSLYDNGSIDGHRLNDLLEHLQGKSTLLWREHCRHKRPGERATP